MGRLQHMRGVIRQGMSSLTRWLPWPRSWRQRRDEPLDELKEILGSRPSTMSKAFTFQVPGRRMIRLSLRELRDPANNPWRQNADPVAHPTVMQTAPANDMNIGEVVLKANPKEGAGLSGHKGDDEEDFS